MKWLKNFILFMILFFVLAFAVITVYIILYPAKYDFTGSRTMAVVFGAGITKGGDPSFALKSRLDKSMELYQNHKIRQIFISGKVAETFVMKSYLLKKHIPAQTIISDFNGKNTMNTVENAKMYARTNQVQDGLVMVSQKYHLPRIALMAVKRNLKNVIYISADPRKIEQEEMVSFIGRESLAFIKALVLDQ